MVDICLIESIYHWPDQAFTYLRIAKCYSSTLTNHFCTNDPKNVKVEAIPTAGPVFMPIRNPMARVVSYYSRSHYKLRFDEYMEKVATELILTDAHVMPYVGAAEEATHVRPVEYMQQWWNEFYTMRPGIFGDYPSRIANRSKDAYRPDPRLVQHYSKIISTLYEQDFEVWYESCASYNAGPFPE